MIAKNKSGNKTEGHIADAGSGRSKTNKPKRRKLTPEQLEKRKLYQREWLKTHKADARRYRENWLRKYPGRALLCSMRYYKKHPEKVKDLYRGERYWVKVNIERLEKEGKL